MARGPETRFIASVHRQLHDSLYRMKTHNVYNGGPADMWYSGKNGDIWIEYKYVHKLPKMIDLIDRKKDYCLSALQEEWLRDRHEEGRRVFVILGYEDGGIVFADRRWEEKWETEAIKKYTRKELAEFIAKLTEGKYEAPVRTRKGLERCL